MGWVSKWARLITGRGEWPLKLIFKILPIKVHLKKWPCGCRIYCSLADGYWVLTSWKVQFLLKAIKKVVSDQILKIFNHISLKVKCYNLYRWKMFSYVDLSVAWIEISYLLQDAEYVIEHFFKRFKVKRFLLFDMN